MPKAPETWRSKARDRVEAPVRAPAAAPGPAALDPIAEVADALTMAAMQGDEDSVAELLASGVSADCKDAIGVAPLHWAAFCGHGGVTGRLIRANADVHVRDQEGRTPLHVAAYESHTEVITHLLQAGADVMSPDKSARAHSQHAHVSSVMMRRALLAAAPTAPLLSLTLFSLPAARACCAVLARSLAVSWTPLHCAVSNGEVAACKQLTDAGADALRKDAEGKSALDLAKHFGNADVLSVLEGAQEQRELLDLKDLGIGSHRGPRRGPTQVSPTSVSSHLSPTKIA